MRFKLFNKKKKKNHVEEKGHREPIIVRIFKGNEKEPGTTVNFHEEEIPTDDNASDAEKAASKKIKFTPSQKYFNISVYSLGVICCAVVFIIIVFNLTPILDWLKNLLSVCSPFIWASLVAFIISPIVNGLDTGFFEKLCKIKKPKLRMALSVFISYVLLIGLLALSMAILIPQVGESCVDLMDRLRLIYGDISNFFSTLQDHFPAIDFSYIETHLTNALPNIISAVTEWVTNSIPALLSTSVTIVKTLINFLLTIAISIYMVCDKRRIARSSTQLVYAILPVKRATNLIRTAKECFQIFGGFIIGKSIDSLIIGILCFIITSLLQMPYALLVSVIVGVTNMIPFFGPIIGAIPGILIYLCLDPVLALIFTIEILILQQFDGWVLGPMILGDSTGIRPIWVIFAITVGGAYFGFIGMFLGVPVTAVFVYLINLWVEKKLKKKKIDVA